MSGRSSQPIRPGSVRDGLSRTEHGTWHTQKLDRARRFHDQYGGVLLLEPDGYEVCVLGCGADTCRCRGDVSYIEALAPSYDETHNDNEGRVPDPAQATLF